MPDTVTRIIRIAAGFFNHIRHKRSYKSCFSYMFLCFFRLSADRYVVLYVCFFVLSFFICVDPLHPRNQRSISSCPRPDTRSARESHGMT